MWGSMLTTILVEEYAVSNFIDYPKIFSMLALSSMQKEGLLLKKLALDLSRQAGTAAAAENRLKVVENRK